MRRAAYLMGAALLAGAAAMMGGAVAMQHSPVDTPNPAEEGTTMTSSNDPFPNDEAELEDDYDLSLEDPVIEDGEPTTWEELARDAAVGQYPDGPPPAVGGQVIFGGDSIGVIQGDNEAPR